MISLDILLLSVLSFDYHILIQMGRNSQVMHYSIRVQGIQSENLTTSRFDHIFISNLIHPSQTYRRTDKYKARSTQRYFYLSSLLYVETFNIHVQHNFFGGFFPLAIVETHKHAPPPTTDTGTSYSQRIPDTSVA